MLTFQIIALIVVYLIVGVVIGAAYTRVAYAFDPKVREWEKDLQRLQQNVIDASEAGDSNAHYQARSQLMNNRYSAERVFDKQMTDRRDQGTFIVFLWPLFLLCATIFGVCWLLWTLGSKTLALALTSGRYQSHVQLVQTATKLEQQTVMAGEAPVPSKTSHRPKTRTTVTIEPERY